MGFTSTKMNLPVSFQDTCGPVFVSDTHFVGYRCTLLSESASVSTAPSPQFKKDTFCLNNNKKNKMAMPRGDSTDKSMAALFIFYVQFIAPAWMQQKSFTLRKKLCIVYLLLGYVASELLDSLTPNPPELSLHSSLPAFSTFLSLRWWKTPKSLVDSGVNLGLAVWFAGLWCGQQQLKSVTPGPHPSGFHHQPWPLTHTKLQPGRESTQLGNASMSLRHWEQY